MKSTQKFVQMLMAVFLIGGLAAAAAIPISTPPLRMQPALARTSAANPDQMVRVIVQLADPTIDKERFIEARGGTVIRDLSFISAVAAIMPAKAAAGLSTLAAVTWVSLDAPMQLASATLVAFRDEFNGAPSYSGSDGLLAWEGDWVEDDVAAPGPAYGNVEIEWGQLTLEDYPNTGTMPSAAREVDLSMGVTSATLSFDFSTASGVDWSDAIAVEMSADGGVTYTPLEIFTGQSGSSSGSRSYDITSYISADTMVRFRVHNLYGGSNEYFAVDNIQIEVGVESNSYLETLGADQLHAEGVLGQGIGVAIIDSGIDNHLDFSGRLTFPTGFGSGDAYGHGTHVAGLIGGDGSASGGLFSGMAPEAHFISLGVTDAFGMAFESDVVAAMQWVSENKDAHNIRVVNLSLNSTVEDSYHNSAIDAAAEILWLNGVVVVASAGNQVAGSGINFAKAAPANDPFIIVVGASDELGSTDRGDDSITAFSAYGITLDGHSRPDIIAPGYDIYGALCQTCSWNIQYPERVGFDEQYIRLSGTSMAAPMVAGAVALLLSDEPGLTPDQVKYRLIQTATPLGGYAYLDAYAAVHGTTTAAANQGQMPHMLLAKMALLAYWASVNGGDSIDWEHVDWSSVNWNSVNWNSVNWNSVNWNSVNWNSVNWNSVNWNSVNWNSVNWNSVNWNSVNWNSVNWSSVNLNNLAGKNQGMGGLFWGDSPYDKIPLPVDEKPRKGEEVPPPTETGPGGSQTIEEKKAAGATNP